MSAKFGIVVYEADPGVVDGFLMQQNCNTVYTDQTALGKNAKATSGVADA